MADVIHIHRPTRAEQRIRMLERQVERADLTIALLQLLVQLRTEERDRARATVAHHVETAMPVSEELVEAMFRARGWVVCDGPGDAS